jgi:hypothetical protein
MGLSAASGYAAEPTCTLKMLEGRYLFGGVTTPLPPAVMQQSLLAVAGYRVFNGDGTAPNGTELIAIGTTPGSVSVTSPSRRVSRK